MMEPFQLHPSSYIILGLVERMGQATPYELKARADEGVGHFWNFSRAILYKEPARLEKLGLLHASQEQTGRRRINYAITKKGRQALSDWLNDPVDSETEIRDLGLLKLFFAASGSLAALNHLIQGKITAHSERLANYRAIKQTIKPEGDALYSLAALEMGLRFEAMSVAFWTDMAKRKIKLPD